MFDIGGRKDWWNMPPLVDGLVRAGVPRISSKYNVNEILEQGGVALSKIQSVVWSRWYYDHIGDIQQFPKPTEVVVGPGFKKTFVPRYPVNKDTPISNTDFEGRNLREIEFDGSLMIGGFPACDLFGDGSFYMLDVPGHAIGHMPGFVRTTPETFVFLGGDVCHFGGSHRPTKFNPMPATIPPGTPLDGPFKAPCPCSVFTACHPDQANARTSTYYKVSKSKGSWYIHPEVAQKSVNQMSEFHADENVFIYLAHDPALITICDWFPNGTIHDWKEKG